MVGPVATTRQRLVFGMLVVEQPVWKPTGILVPFRPVWNTSLKRRPVAGAVTFAPVTPILATPGPLVDPQPDPPPLMQSMTILGVGRIVPASSMAVALAIVGFQRTEMLKVLNVVEPRMLKETFKRLCPTDAVIGGRFWGQSVESPGTMQTRPTKGGGWDGACAWAVWGKKGSSGDTRIVTMSSTRMVAALRFI